jgi:excisionase family DNA binding protein
MSQVEPLKGCDGNTATCVFRAEWLRPRHGYGQNNAVAFGGRKMKREVGTGMGLQERLDRIESLLTMLVEQQQTKEWYTTEELARLLGKAELTVREWCRRGRIRAEKRLSGRGAYPAWVISHEELLRYQKEGLRPLPTPDNLQQRGRN